MSSAQTPRSASSRPLASFISNSEIPPGITGNGEITESGSGGHSSAESQNRHKELNGRVVSAGNARLEEVDRYHEVQGQRKHKPKSSGGFLLPSTSEHDTQAGPSRRSLFGTSGDTKGKRKSENEDLRAPKSRTAAQRQRLRPSLGGSPLSTEVYNFIPARNPEDTGLSNPDEISPIPSKTSRTSGSIRSSASADRANISSQANYGQHLERGTRSALGPDTDPAEIVNLALNLSESRRRNFSGSHLSPVYPLGSRRFMSSNQPSAVPPSNLPITTRTGGSLRQHLQDQRRISRNISPRTRKSERQGAEFPTVAQGSNDSPQSTAVPTSNLGLADGTVFNPTEATLSRAEKAKLTLELSYEHRRLLQYLPAIPVRPRSRSTTSKTAPTAKSNASTSLGRVYNPLQYIRNRRVRAREKRTLDAVAGGWKDIDRVRKWVGTVASEREAGFSRVDNHYPLPPYDVVLSAQALLDPTPALSESHSTGRSNIKSRKLPGSWTTTPWDLLADVHWLGQDDNKKHIEDSTGNKIFSTVDVVSDVSPRPTRDGEVAPKRPLETIHKQVSAEDIQVATAATLDNPKERGRPRKPLYESHSPMHSHNGSLDRKGRWSKNFMRSRSSSSSGHSPTDEVIRHRRGYSVHDGFDSAALRKQMNDILKREAEDALYERRHTKDRAGLKPLNRDQADGYVSHGESQRTDPRGTRKDQLASEHVPSSTRISLDEKRDRQSLDSMRNSPSAHGTSPKIAIDLAPPGDQPSSPKKPLPSQLGSLRPHRKKGGDAISQYDFASDSKALTNLSRQETNELRSKESLQPGDNSITNNSLLSPSSGEFMDNRVRLSDSNSVKNVKITRDSDSKLRGLLKGGRIAELVGNEVSRVGDLFWRRDRDNTASPASPMVSNFAREDSDYDEDTSGMDSPPDASLSRATTNSEDTTRLSRSSTNIERPKYHIDNLPSFRTPFGRGDQSAGPTVASSKYDHITRQQLEQRQRGRSPRFDRLAPPRIDMRNVSPSASPPMTRSQTRETDISYDNSRQSSASRSDYRARSADRRLNEVLGAPGSIGRNAPPPSGISGLEIRQHRSQQRPKIEKGRQWSICDRGVSEVRGAVTKRDIAHVRALLLSSGVKANEIVRRAHAIGETQSPFLNGLEEISSGPIPPVPRNQEHRLAARVLVNNIELTNQDIRDTADHFSNTAVENLHRQIKAIDERVTHQLTPMVRAAADDADAFSTQLTTTHTLAVKQLNDAVDIILRRRRRRLRWLRRGGFVLLEWTLLGIMWWAWFIVVLVRLVRGILGGVISGVKWFFWL